MLLNRRLRLLFICTAGMDVVVFTPFFLLLLGMPLLWRAGEMPRPLAVLTPLAWMWPGILAAMFVLEVLNRRRMGDRAYFALTLGLMVTTTLLAVRLILHPGIGWTEWGWLGNTADTLFNFHRGLRMEFVVVAGALFVWQRAIRATSRGIGFFGVGMGFRVGVLLLFLGGGLLSGLNPAYGQSAQLLLWAYFGLGLVAVAIARLDDKSKNATTSKGALMPPRMVAAVTLASALCVGAMALFSAGFTPAHIRRAIAWFNPLWLFLGDLLVRFLAFFFILLSPVFNFLEWLFLLIMTNSNLAEVLGQLTELGPREEAAQQLEQLAPVPAWIFKTIRYGVVGVVLLVVLFLVLLFLAKVQARLSVDEGEDVGQEAMRLNGNFLRRGLDRLREMARLAGRFPLGSQLLAAISVQNMYANLTRMARRRGHPRRPAQPPDEYLPVLALAFPGQDAALERLTAAYMRVHYGDRTISRDELAQIRQDYHAVRQSDPPVDVADGI